MTRGIRLPLVLSLLLLPACATINKGTSDFFRIDSVPQGAAATTSIETSYSLSARRKDPSLTPQYLGCAPTPCAIKMSRREDFIITLEHENYETAKMFITHSRRSGSFTANMAQTSAVVGATTAAGAVIGAGLATTLSAVTAGIASATTAATVTVGSFGLIPIEAGLAVTNSVFVPTSVSTSSAMAAAIPPALAITGGSLLIDAVSGANINIYPNPVVLKMAPKGTPTKLDPNVAPFLESINARGDLIEACVKSRPRSRDRLRLCRVKVSGDIRQRKADLRKKLLAGPPAPPAASKP